MGKTKWRPEGWITSDKRPEFWLDRAMGGTGCCDFEAGADAMLEALRKHAHREGKNLTKAQWLAFWGTNAEGSGCIVFIPDDREE